MTDYSQFPIPQKLERLSWRSDDPSLGDCRCPAHEDATNSLHVTIKVGECDDSKLLFKCLAGCANADILRALGEGFSALFPDRTRGNRNPSSSAGKKRRCYPRPVKIYNYLNPVGEILHQTLRYEPKDFRQRRPATKAEKRAYWDDGQWWINSLQGIEPVIYSLPLILKSDPKKFIFLCEGEKDADNLRNAFGFLTTTVPMGAGKWRKSYTEAFRGRRVIIVPDTDKPRKGQTDPAANPGFDGARRIATELVSVASEVRIAYSQNRFELTPKYDISDEISAGLTKKQFLEACNAAEVLTPRHPGLIPAGIESTDSPPTSAENRSDPSSVNPPFLSNYATNSEGENVPIPIQRVLKAISKITNGWPRRVGSSLFIYEHNHVDFLNSPSALFGWLGSRLSMPPDFCRAAACHSKSEVYEELCRSAEEYAGIEFCPHEPELPGHFYAVEPLPESNGEHLRWLINRFCPATDLDIDLIKAAFMTVFCGLPYGSRPAFLITADGPGAGKTTLATILGQLAGGLIDVSPKDDIHKIKERLLSPEGKRRRLGVLDNLKTLRFSWAEFESLITTPTISGKELYKGESQRPNSLTWILTLNGVSLSKDMSQRCVIIELKRPPYSGTWKEETLAYVEEHRNEIIADIIMLLREPRQPLEKFTRWATWEREIVCRLPLPAEAQRVIMERQETSDVDSEECDEIEAYFARQLERLKYSPDTNKVAIPSEVCCDWLSKVLKESYTLRRSTSALKTHQANGSIKRLEYRHWSQFRGFVWSGADCRPSETVYTDIVERVTKDRIENVSFR